MNINTFNNGNIQDTEANRKLQLVSELKLKFSSKKDLHRYLTEQCKTK